MSTCEWYTPEEVYRALGLTYDVDPCSPGRDVIPWSMAKVHLTRRENGLTTPWWRTRQRFWMNPPYDDMPPWVERALMCAAIGGTGIVLGPCLLQHDWAQVLMEAAGTTLITNWRIPFVPGEGQQETTPRTNHVLWGFGDRECGALQRVAYEMDWGVCVRGDRRHADVSRSL